jgi:hypothetical protein
MAYRFGQVVVAAVGAVLLTATAVGAAVGPAHVLETPPGGVAATGDSGQARA